ncbi:hypothetical protein [Lactiplantibacillus plantarum]|uniref:hypothetical protein n=1 Tax=Lactiplantibacillus plantarum TaxID=1590 RepID=UPI000CCE6674|nr:hypothetical protein [Lactiplantibacillus plantarum]MDO8182067.1 hypothetical protein [Lactiplantibacillus plantarum]PNW62959.1 hypothetical protein ACZ99_10115 [Lactobacillus sp. ATCC 15578]RHX76679.1 hypothetical protein D2U09_03360 [Lactiplantibacillus plantarum]TXJ95568.1 hypothetical protein FU657_06935 [Lactiplantibacillus plantarum]
MEFNEENFLNAARLVGLDVKRSNNPGVLLKDNEFIPGKKFYETFEKLFLTTSHEIESQNTGSSTWSWDIIDDNKIKYRRLKSLFFESVEKKFEPDITRNDISTASTFKNDKNWPLVIIEDSNHTDNYDEITTDSINYEVMSGGY